MFFSLPDDPVMHDWVFPGQCPHSLGEWAWVPFRHNCYAFNLQNLRLQQDARTSCEKGRKEFHKLPRPYSSWSWKPIKCNTSDLLHCRHNWLNASICLNLEQLFTELSAPLLDILTWSIPFSLLLILCVYFLPFLSSSGSWTSLYLGRDRKWIRVGTHPELCRAGAWSLVRHQC